MLGDFFVKNRRFLGFSAFLQISFLMYPQNPFFLVHPLQCDWNMVCTNFQIVIWPTWLKIPKIGSKNPYFQFFHFSPSQNPIFFGASCPTQFIYGLYQFLALTLTYRAQNPKNRAQKCRFLPYFHKKKFTFAQNQYFWYILSNMVQIWSVPIFSPDVDLHGSKSQK